MGADQFGEAFDGGAGGIDDRADGDDFGLMFFVGEVGRDERQLLAAFEAADEFFGKSEADTERAFGGDPEETIAFGDALAFARVATSDQAAERRHDASFFEFQLKRVFFFFCGVELFFYAQDVPLVGFDFVLGVLELFFGDEFFVPEALGADVVRLENFCLGFPIFKVGLDAAGFGAGGFEIGDELTIIQFCQDGAGVDAVPGVSGDRGDYAVALSGDVDLMFDD